MRWTARRDALWAFSLLLLSLDAAWAGAPLAQEDAKTATLENDQLRLVFNKEAQGNLSAILDKRSNQNLLAPSGEPRRLYAISLADDQGNLSELTNNDAAGFRLEVRRWAGEAQLFAFFEGHAGKKISATVCVILRPDSPLSTWRVEVVNREDVVLKSVTFPLIGAPLTIGPDGVGDAVVLPVCDGCLIEQPSKTMPKGATRKGPYPGGMSAQMMAFCGKPAGLYMAAHDNGGSPKEFGVTRREGDLLFFYTHRFPERRGKGWVTPYEIVLGTFNGDWHAAADIYKEWAARQHWCRRPIAHRGDLPAWLKEAPVFHALSARARSKEKGYYNSLPILPAHVRSFCEALKTKECAMIMAWEKNSAWVTPDYFPPFGGADLFGKTMSDILKDGNHTFVFLSGLKWTLKNANVKDYDGWAAFEKEGARAAVAGPDGKPLIVGKADADVTAGTGQYAQLCAATSYAKDLLTKIALACVDLGITCVQMDQVVGMGTPPCYSKEHGHPAGYGVWQYEQLRDLFHRMKDECRKKNPDFAFSIEEPAELAIPLLDVYHARDYAQGRWPRGRGLRGVPLFTYLYHEYCLGYGGDSAQVSPWPNDMYVMQHAANLVCGKTPGIAVWGGLVEVSQIHPDQLRILKAHTNLLRTRAREYLVMGRMIHPLVFETPRITIKVWEKGTSKSFPMDFPSVLQSGWTLPNGNRGYFLANIAHEDVAVATEAPGSGGASITAYSTDTGQSALLADRQPLPREIAFTLRPQEVRFVEVVEVHKVPK